MGLCTSKPSPRPDLYASREEKRVPENPKPSEVSVNGGNENHNQQQQHHHQQQRQQQKAEAEVGKKSPFFPFYSPSPAHYLFSKKSPAPSSNSTPRRFFKKPFPPPSPAKHIRAVLARRHGSVKPNEAAIPEGNESESIAGLDKSFGFSKHFASKYELGDEVGRGHFGYTCAARFKKGELKGQQVAVKVIPKAKRWGCTDQLFPSNDLDVFSARMHLSLIKPTIFIRPYRLGSRRWFCFSFGFSFLLVACVNNEPVFGAIQVLLVFMSS